MKLSKKFTTVTRLSKTIALILFIALPFIGFGLGMRYQQFEDQLMTMTEKSTNVMPNMPTPSPSFFPQP